MRCDLLVRPVPALSQLENLTVAWRQLAQCPREQIALAAPVDKQVLLSGYRRRQKIELRLRHRRVTTSLPRRVDTQIAGYDGQPRVEASFTSQIRQRLPGPRECFLGGVLSLCAVLEASQAIPVQALVIVQVELGKCRLVPVLSVIDEHPIPLEIDVTDSIVGQCHRSRL